MICTCLFYCTSLVSLVVNVKSVYYYCTTVSDFASFVFLFCVTNMSDKNCKRVVQIVQKHDTLERLEKGENELGVGKV